MGSSSSFYLLSAILVGSTFMGTVTIAMSAAQKIKYRVKFNMLAVMTLSYGVGQIIGPLLAEALRAYSETFNSSLIAAAIGLVLAGAITAKPSKQLTN
tara:strand:- start:1163 stop:1456 length:294 start_codon:yes stop_codon:yes gene_type:complete